MSFAYHSIGERRIIISNFSLGKFPSYYHFKNMLLIWKNWIASGRINYFKENIIIISPLRQDIWTNKKQNVWYQRQIAAILLFRMLS